MGALVIMMSGISKGIRNVLMKPCKLVVLVCGEICVTLIYILSVYEARNFQSSLPQRGVTLDKEWLLPLVRPDSKTIGNGTRDYKNM